MLDVCILLGWVRLWAIEQEKPKKIMNQLVSEMKDSRGINFIYCNEDDAEDYLFNVNNYLRRHTCKKIIQNIIMVLIEESILI